MAKLQGERDATIATQFVCTSQHKSVQPTLFSSNGTAPSAPTTGSLQTTFLISLTDSLIHLIGVCERHPEA